MKTCVYMRSWLEPLSFMHKQHDYSDVTQVSTTSYRNSPTGPSKTQTKAARNMFMNYVTMIDNV